MSIQVLTNAEDTMAAMYQSSNDWAFGPTALTYGTRISAKELMEKFIEWADLRRRGPYADWSDEWLKERWSNFLCLNWRNCPECEMELVPAANQEIGEAGICHSCLHRCGECGDFDVETKLISSPGRRSIRMCEICERQHKVAA